MPKPERQEDHASDRRGVPGSEVAPRSTKRQLQEILATPAAGRLWKRLLGDRLTIFMLHRFAVPELNVDGCSPDLLRRVLQRLRKEGFDLIDVEEAYRRLSDPDSTFRRPAVCFTIDDGYFDATEVAAQVFLEYDCPATVFVTTAFLDGETWHWWDQVAWMLERTDLDRLEVETAAVAVDCPLDGAQRRAAVARALITRCKRVSDAERVHFLGKLSERTGIEVPRCPPAQFRPVRWSDARALEARGLRFGPHSVSHRVLTNTDDAVSRSEIEQSWLTMQARLENPVPVFAYPNGDFGPREIRYLEEAGLEAAVCTSARYARASWLRSHPLNRYGIPRLPFPETEAQAYLNASGFSRISEFLRGRPT
jgi:peptidoglycan/xylan/chitin deacetylase (PgdA/CDA1 family)